MILSAVEFAIRGPRATRWRSSLFLIGAGIAGAAAGAWVDGITSSISPAYFAIGKGLGQETGLQRRAIHLGLQAGCSAGVLVGGILLATAIVGQRRAAPIRSLVATLRYPLLGALLFGTMAGGLGALAIPTSCLGDFSTILSPAEQRPFLTVWSAHAGVYAGTLLGTLLGARRIHRYRREDLDHEYTVRGALPSSEPR
jgi:hypothetical protein